jgi:DNA-binding MarR family transcriptional regulator
METETLFTSTKWEVLKTLSDKPQSPLQIAQTLNTSIANVSQQLRLLELAGLVWKKRLPREKEDRRILYSIKSQKLYAVLIAKKRAQKAFIELDERKSALISSWMIEDSYYQILVENFVIDHQEQLKDFDLIAFRQDIPELHYVSSKLTLSKKSIQSSDKHSIPVKKSSHSEIDDLSEKFILIHVGGDTNEDIEDRGDRK